MLGNTVSEFTMPCVCEYCFDDLNPTRCRSPCWADDPPPADVDRTTRTGRTGLAAGRRRPGYGGVDGEILVRVVGGVGVAGPVVDGAGRGAAAGRRGSARGAAVASSGLA